MPNISSVVAMIAVAGMAYLSLRMLRTALGRRVLWLAVAALWRASIAAIIFVDVNIPFSQSHLRPSGAIAPLWLAIAALFVRFAAIASVFVAHQSLRQAIAEPSDRLQPMERKSRSD